MGRSHGDDKDLYTLWAEILEQAKIVNELAQRQNKIIIFVPGYAGRVETLK